ncbi:MAG: hypothetical protein WDW38_010053 [Sanguina aurantia]
MNPELGFWKFSLAQVVVKGGRDLRSQTSAPHQPPAPPPPPALPWKHLSQVVVNFSALSAYCINLFPVNKDAPKERQILFDVSGRVEPGEVLALMGPSGSGKTSLLSILGRRSTVRVAGDITFNGRPADKAIKRRLGFVTQDDLLFPDLTVDETLFYAAMLRLPASYSRERKLARVDDVLSALGLGKCRSTIIGGGMRRGVSGGERKRVAIGHELLTDPSILFLDEPTSGLDSTTALKLMQTLRSLASGGRTMITSIHQPSSRLYQHMDKLMLLSEGHTIFYGSAHLAAAWFAQQRCPSPFGVNISDHMLDLACGECGDDGEGEESGAAVRERLVAAFEGRKTGAHRRLSLPPAAILPPSLPPLTPPPVSPMALPWKGHEARAEIFVCGSARAFGGLV